MARKAAPVKFVPLNVSVHPNLKEAVEDIRWGKRMRVAEVVTEALTEYFANQGIKVDLSVPDESTK